MWKAFGRSRRFKRRTFGWFWSDRLEQSRKSLQALPGTAEARPEMDEAATGCSDEIEDIFSNDGSRWWYSQSRWSGWSSFGISVVKWDAGSLQKWLFPVRSRRLEKDFRTEQKKVSLKSSFMGFRCFIARVDTSNTFCQNFVLVKEEIKTQLFERAAANYINFITLPVIDGIINTGKIEIKISSRLVIFVVIGHNSASNHIIFDSIFITSLKTVFKML